MRQTSRTGLVLLAVLALPACQSARFGDAPAPVLRAPAPVGYNVPGALEPAPAVPAGNVTSAPLAPPPGVPSLDPSVPSADGPIIADAPPMPAAAPPPAPAPVQVAAVAPSRSSVVGGWTAREASGSSCRITLSSSSVLELYRASASGCQNQDLAGVNAWDYRDGEVFLYQRGGAVAARLRSGGGSLDGVLAKSGAPLTLNR